MGKFNREIINLEEIKNNLDVYQVLEYYEIEAECKSKICCPLHSEDTPSFSIYNDGKLFKCFGCGQGGDAIRLVQLMENVSYIEAVQIAGEITGKEPIFSASYKKMTKSSESNKLMECLNNKYFTKHDYGSENWKKLNDYLESRVINRETSIAYGIGYSYGEYEEVVHVFEGVFDCLTAIQCGYPNSVGLLGVNAMTDNEKAVLLKANKVFLHFDDDETGRAKVLEVAEQLGYKAHIVEPINVGGEMKDLNGLFISVCNTYSSSMSEEEAFNKAVNDVRKNLNKRTFGIEVESDDEHAEPTFIGGAKNLVQIRLEEWLSYSDSKRAEQFQNLIEVVYKQYSGQSALIGSFKKLITNNKEYGISAKVFDDTVKEVKGEVALTVRNSSNTPSFGNAEIIYEVINNILYKMTPIILKGEVLTEKMDEISTTIPIIKGILYDKSDNKEKVEIEFTNSSGKVIKIITPKETILKKNAIIDALGSKGLDVTDVTSQDMVLWLRQYAKKNSIPRKELVKMTGLYKVDGQYYCICQRGEIISEKGLIDDFSLIYYSDLIDRSIKEITEVSHDEWKESVNAIPMILKLNERANTLALTSYMLSSVFREFFYNECGAYTNYF